jgi:colicin import membrane protein
MKTSTSLLALAFVLAAPAAFAHPGDDATKTVDMHDKMARHDMTPEQHRQMADTMWADMDANKDGSVTRAEYDAHVARAMAMRKQRHDGMSKDGAWDKSSHEAAEASEKSAHAAAEAKEDAIEAKKDAEHAAAEAKEDAAEAAAKKH